MIPDPDCKGTNVRDCTVKTVEVGIPIGIYTQTHTHTPYSNSNDLEKLRDL